MFRQRIRARSSPVAFFGRAVLVLFLLGVLWYGLMLVLLGFGVGRGPIDLISGYRTAFDFLAGLEPAAITPRVRLITAVSGIVAAFLFGYLAYKEIPRPYAARRSLDLAEQELGGTAVAPRAIERVAESASFGNRLVSGAAGRWEGSGVNLDVHLDRARELPATLEDIQQRVRGALGEHELPEVPVTVTLTGFDHRPTGRNVSR